MIPAGYGRIINIASMYGLVGNNIAPAAAYHAAKGGVVNLTRALASEWGNKGITVNAICPGYFETPLTKETLDSEFFQQYAKTMIPLNRYGARWPIFLFLLTLVIKSAKVHQRRIIRRGKHEEENTCISFGVSNGS